MSSIEEKLEEMHSALDEQRVYLGDTCEGLETASRIVSEFPVENMREDQKDMLNFIMQAISRSQKNAHLAAEIVGETL